VSILAYNPSELIFVTIVNKYHTLLDFASSLDPRIKVYYTEITNERIQLCEANPSNPYHLTIDAQVLLRR